MIVTIGTAFGKDVVCGENRVYKVKEARVVGLVSTSEGNLFASEMNIVPVTNVTETNKCLPSTMGFKLFYGICDKGHLHGFISKGNLKKAGLASLKKLGVKEIFFSWGFAPKKFSVDGEEMEVHSEIDLTPEETTKEALLWHSVGVI